MSALSDKIAAILPDRATLKYDLQIMGMILVGLPAYYNELPILTPHVQGWITLLSVVYGLAVGIARPAGVK